MTIPVSEGLLPPYLRESGRVIYSLGNTHGSLYGLNFCHFCKELRDHKDMTYEIEMRRCTSCTEPFTSAESPEKEMVCPQCFECPVCSQALVVRSSPASSSAPVVEDSASAEKRYYLTCQNCRWSTRGAGIADFSRPPSVNQPWKFPANDVEEQKQVMAALSDYYRALCVAERGAVVPKGREKRKSRISYNPLVPDKYKLVSVAQKRISGVPEPPADLEFLKAKTPQGRFVENVKEISEEELFGYMDPKVGEARLPLSARFLFPVEQPPTINHLRPLNRPLSGKRTWRCKSCQHVLVKTDFAAHSVKFKMISSAPLLVPIIKPCKPNSLVDGQTCDLVLVMSNPLNHNVSVSFSAPPADEPVPKWIAGQLADQTVLPSGNVTLLSRNCAAGIDEKGKEAVTALPDDEPSVIAFRKLYTVGVRFSCVPVSSELDTWMSFMIRYDFRENQATVFEPEKNADGDASSGQCSWITMRIDVNLGQAASTK